MKVYKMNEDYRWLVEYREYMIFCQLQVKKKWLWFTWFGNAFRGFYLSPIRDHKGSELGVRIGLHRVFCYDEATFSLRSILDNRFDSYLKNNVSNCQLYKRVTGMIESL